ncbi:MAG TPA: hypothetical protein VMG82_17270 [Candidatus Sulfotelmatobacter sp.]|nr:hypothetical protein [Candidatus Sulfotelmatobacter sp.]
MKTLALARSQHRGLVGSRRCGFAQPRLADPAAGIGGEGRLICHATTTSAAILALPVAMIEPGFQALLVAAVGLSQLFPPILLPARLAAVSLPAVAGKTDEEHRSATHGAAKQLSQYQFRSHCLCRQEWTMAVPLCTLKLIVVVLSCFAGRATRNGNPDRCCDRGFHSLLFGF